MSASNRKAISILTVILAVSVIALGLSAFQGGATPGANPGAPQGQLPTVAITPYPTPFNPGPEVEGTEIGEGISQEGGYFINDLAARLNVPVDTLEAAVSSSLSDSVNQALNQGLIDQNAANQLNQRATQMFNTGNGFFFDIDEFGDTNTPTPAQSAPLVVTSVVTSVVTEEPRPTKTNEPTATATLFPTKIATLVKGTPIIKATFIFPTRVSTLIIKATFIRLPSSTPVKQPTFPLLRTRLAP